VVSDLDGDGVADYLVSAPYQKVDFDYVQGEVFLFDGRDGRHLSTFDDPSPPRSEQAEAAEEGRLRLGRIEEPHAGPRPLP
jgi:hypothetical protein